MTNKPMLSVERELLELVTDNKHIDKESISIRRWEALCKLRSILSKPAGQLQAEPVAWVIQWGSVIPDCRGHREVVLKDPGALDAVITPLYAQQQPAPVAVVMPDKINPESLYPDQADCGWNDCIDEVRRLNGVKP